LLLNILSFLFSPSMVWVYKWVSQAQTGTHHVVPRSVVGLSDMDHQDHVHLLHGGIPQPGGVWADLGSGSGAFTLALAECLGTEGEIYSVDKNGGELQRQQQAMHARFPAVIVHYLTADFTRPLPLPPLDGIVVANALHFLRHKDSTLQLIRGYLKPAGRLIIVEYNVDRGNLWVPHPFSYPTWESIARQNGFEHTELLATRPSRFLGEIYAALSQATQPDDHSKEPA
jgi:ubiquinone/menaquinone biosynthesis C-methylase UbiE